MLKDIVKEIASKMAGKTILVVGDVGLDEYVNGAVRRISPEAPVPVLDVNKQECRLGLSANVAQNISSLGGVAELFAVVGNDEAGEKIKQEMAKEKISVENFLIDLDRPTTKKLRVMAGHNHIVRVDYEKRTFLSKELEQKALEKIEKKMFNCDGVIIQDYAKGMISESLVQSIVEMAKKYKKKILVDPHRSAPLKTYSGVDLFKPNFEEALTLTGMSFDSLHQKDDLIKTMAEKIKVEAGVSNIVITQGSKGMSIFSKNSSENVPTRARQVYDVTGAGDTVIAALSLAWCSGFSLKESCEIANFAAGVVVAKIGCVPCSVEELEKAILLG